MPKLEKRIDPVFVSEIFECAHIAGFDGPKIAAQITHRAEDMSLQEYGKLWFALAHEMQDEMLGMMEFPMRPGSFGLMCHAILGAGTLEKAIRRTLLFLKVVAGAPIGTLSVRNGHAHITFSDDAGPRSAFAYRTMLIVLLGPVFWLAQRQIPLVQVSFRCGVPADEKAYNGLFGTPVQFDANNTKVVFSAEFLSLPINRSEAALARFLKQAPGNLLVGYSATDNLIGKVRHSLAQMPATTWPGFDEFAKQFGTSPSTLRRQLKANGTSFRAIKADVRFAIARKALMHSDVSVSDLAEKLGYAEPGAFFRAFRKWAGATPAEFRADHRDN
ncbi:AraC family transcriptional regulator [Shimia thalassica]|nr:AraC family transcriptional regulator [Shimia thalassica]MDO6521428.1 AraC family transcriptional regulator [Shimia thalassica]